MSMRLAIPDDGAALAEIYQPFVEATAVSFETTPPDAKTMAERITTGREWRDVVWMGRELGETSTPPDPPTLMSDATSEIERIIASRRNRSSPSNEGRFLPQERSDRFLPQERSDVGGGGSAAGADGGGSTEEISPLAGCAGTPPWGEKREKRDADFPPSFAGGQLLPPR